jgi:hypothetical protein
MATPSAKLAESLKALRNLQEKGIVALRSADLTRTDRERLAKSGYLQEVMKGWYIPARPDETVGESTAWYTSFWHFCAAYLKERFGNDWSLSPEQSLILHAGNRSVPRQLLVRASSARNQITNLPHNTSLLEIRATLPDKGEVVEQEGLRLFSLRSALVAVPAGFYIQNPTDARVALSMIRDASDVLAPLLDGGHSVVAGRLAGAFRNIARGSIADDILEGMRSAGYTVRESDPFETQSPLSLPERERSPYVNRVRLMWQAMREPILQIFPDAPGLPRDIDAYLKKVSDTYVLDAYHSLSIEGYLVSAELIDRVRSGTWYPELDENDRKSRDALAARGYWQAYQAVGESVRRILRGENPGIVADQDHRIWYRELFGPSVTAGLLKPSDLAGYRHGPVYIRRSMHVPPRDEAVRDIMPAFFELLRTEDQPAVRVVLGHFIFVYTHPYMDGNGRMGRFLMNTMLASGGYPWTVLPVGERAEYMAALEDASVRQDIKPFAEFLSRLVKDSMKGKMPSVPST